MVPRQDGTGNGEGQPPRPPSPSAEEARLKAVFESVEPVEVVGLSLAGKTPEEIVRLLPRFTTLEEEEGNPACGLLVDTRSGRVYALRSGFSPHKSETLNGIQFKKGTLTKAVAASAGIVWKTLGAHVEGQAAAFMRRMEIREAVLYLNASNPCKLAGEGCLFKLPELLSAGARLTVYNKRGRAFVFEGRPG